MKMKYCDDCKTYSIAGNNICLNCNTRWIYVTKRNTISIFLLFTGWAVFVYYVVKFLWMEK